MSGKLLSTLGCMLLLAASVGCGTTAGADPAEPDRIIIEEAPPGTAFVVTLVAPEADSMRALWKVSGYVIGKDATWGEKEAQALLFKGLDINESSITFNGQSCSPVSFQVETVKTGDFLGAAWQTSPAELGIPDGEARLYKTNCDLPGFGEYLRLSDARLVVPINGVFFLFKSTAVR